MNLGHLEPHHVEQLTLDTEPWLSCDDCFALVDRYVEGLLGGGVTGDVTLLPELREMQAHLSGCPACAEEAATLAALAAEEAGPVER